MPIKQARDRRGVRRLPICEYKTHSSRNEWNFSRGLLRSTRAPPQWAPVTAHGPNVRSSFLAPAQTARHFWNGDGKKKSQRPCRSSPSTRSWSAVHDCFSTGFFFYLFVLRVFKGDGRARAYYTRSPTTHISFLMYRICTTFRVPRVIIPHVRVNHLGAERRVHGVAVRPSVRPCTTTTTTAIITTIAILSS